MRTGQHGRRRDWNEAEIVTALRQIGVQIFHISAPGLGDLLAWTASEGWRVIEVKQPRGRLTPQQTDLHARVPVCVVRSVQQALELYGVEA